jgi:Domain of unknown function (DUF5625)
MKRSWTEMLVAVTVTLIVLAFAVRWLFGASPYVQFMKLIHNDIPRQVIPVELVQGTPVTFRTRIIQSMTYDLNLLVYFEDREQRARVDDLIGTGARWSGRLLTVVRIVVRDEQDRTIYDQTVRSEGVIKTSNYFVGRRLEKLALNEGVYDVSVTPLSDMSGIAPFRSALEVYYLTK